MREESWRNEHRADGVDVSIESRSLINAEALPGPATGRRGAQSVLVPTAGQEFWRGAAAMIPLWAGVVPFAVAFAVIARSEGFTLLEVAALSGVLFAGSAQLAVVSMVAAGSGLVAVTLTVLLLNLRHLLYGVSLRPMLSPHSRIPRPLLAFLLTDEAYGVTVHAYQQGRGSNAFLLGAGVSLYVVFNAATLGGAVLGAAIPDPSSLGLDFVFPLTFLALLLPLLRTSRHVAVALIAGVCALAVGRVAGGGVTIVAATLTAAVCGAMLDRRDGRPRP
jgi:4-azaleucine resistance transporter AzlC